MLRIVSIHGLLLTLVVLQWSAAQTPSDKPDAPTPKTTQALNGLPKKPSAAEGEKRTPESQKVADLPGLAVSIAAFISVAGCQPKICTVLVTDFTFPDGNTSSYGMQLADTLSRELTSNEYKLRAIDRRLLQTFLAKERVPALSENRSVIRSISDALEARFISRETRRHTFAPTTSESAQDSLYEGICKTIDATRTPALPVGA